MTNNIVNRDAKYLRKSKEVKTKTKFDASTTPIYYLEDPEENGLTPQETQKLWQYGVDTGIVWHLQGWYGRNAQALLDSGYIKYPKKKTLHYKTDYYGNKLRTRD